MHVQNSLSSSGVCGVTGAGGGGGGGGGGSGGSIGGNGDSIRSPQLSSPSLGPIRRRITDKSTLSLAGGRF